MRYIRKPRMAKKHESPRSNEIDNTAADTEAAEGDTHSKVFGSSTKPEAHTQAPACSTWLAPAHEIDWHVKEDD